MKKDLILTSTVGMSREKWLADRRKSIGGSDAAAILGLNPFTSPLAVYLDKKGLAEERPDNLAMALGRELEDFVARRFAEDMGKTVRRKNAIIRDPKMPWAHADIDRVIVGENAGLECKTTSELHMKRYKNGEYPASYYVQCQHYNAVCGFDRMYLRVLVGNREERTFIIERDEDEIASLMAQELAFWQNYVLPGIAPEPSGSDRDTDALNAMYPFGDSDADALDLTDMRDCFEAYFAANAQKAACERILAKAKQDIEARLGTAERGFCGGHKVTWKAQTRSDIDKAALKELATKHGFNIPYITKATRTLRFTAAK